MADRIADLAVPDVGLEARLIPVDLVDVCDVGFNELPALIGVERLATVRLGRRRHFFEVAGRAPHEEAVGGHPAPARLAGGQGRVLGRGGELKGGECSVRNIDDRN